MLSIRKPGDSHARMVAFILYSRFCFSLSHDHITKQMVLQGGSKDKITLQKPFPLFEVKT